MSSRRELLARIGRAAASRVFGAVQGAVADLGKGTLERIAERMEAGLQPAAAPKPTPAPKAAPAAPQRPREPEEPARPTAQQQARREAESSSYEASHDALTGLLNRRALLRQLESLQLAAVGAARRHMLLFLDLDGFKAVNDTGGHEAGDALLVQIADSLRESVRLQDSVARIGGDEFAVVLVDCPSERGMQIADVLVRAVKACSIPHEGGQLSAGVSLGAVVLEPSEGLSVNELLRRADTACYEAKRHGRGQIRLHDVELSAGT